MKSTIKIDLDGDNMPVIIINHVHSEDVRDKMVARFLQNGYINDSERWGVSFALASLIFEYQTVDSCQVRVRTLTLKEIIEDNEDVPVFLEKASSLKITTQNRK